jgi:hypothetical protein
MPPKAKVPTRAYNVDYLKYGFITSPQDERQPLCLICKKTFSNEAMKPSRLKDHLSRVHTEKENADLEYFKKLNSEFNARPLITSMFRKQNTVSESGLKASYEIASLIAKTGKPHTIGETLIIPAVKVVMRTMLQKDSHEVTTNLPLSNNSVGRRIDEMAANVEEQLVKKLQQVKFALQVDESVVRDSEALLLAYVRFIDEGAMKEEFLFAQSLKTDTTAASIYESVRGFFAEKHIPLGNISACATDGAPCMVGRHRGFLSLLKTTVPGLFTVHCILHREHLVAKRISGCLHDALKVRCS